MTKDAVVFLGSAMIAGVLVAVALIIFVFATGQTFGQRCAKLYADGPNQDACVSRLAHGEAP